MTISLYARCYWCDEPAMTWIDGATPACVEHDPDLTDDERDTMRDAIRTAGF